MHSKRFQISIILILSFFLLVSAKPAKKRKKIESPFEKLKKEYITYKHSSEELKESKLKDFYLKFEKFYEKGNEKESIPAYYFCADVMEKLFEITGNSQYLDDALKIYKKISIINHAYSMPAKKKLELYNYSVKSDRESPMTYSEEKIVNTNNSIDKQVKIIEIKYLEEDGIFKVITDLTGNTNFDYRFLNEDLDNKKPKRIVIDIKNAIIGENVSQVILVSNKIVDKIRVGQFTKEIARIVVDLNQNVNYKVYSLNSPSRIVLDIYSEDGLKKNALIVNKVKEDTKGTNNNNGLKLTVKKVVIDTGHGGHDPGAIGFNGLKEKDVVLDIGIKLGKLIRQNFPDIEVIYTRDDDFYLTLEERTKIANTKKSDLFISIHANASKNKNARGIETYFLDFAKEERAKEVAARENATTLQGVDEVQAILRDLIVSSKYNESTLLASLVQKNLVNKLSKVYDQVYDLGVKQGPFYVLIGAAMPSILVETSFISNDKEGFYLSKEEYRAQIAEGIFEGVREYILKTAVAIDNDKQKFVAR